ncbi:hypothetical protein [Nonomuraea harbinensis]|uniref:Core-binding (CB) domain-containing protein n=1 Tax=Nonomuraea harbinensis TaxID=1286938 RepID=A0ABW1C0F5_9ACTN|nr:hypothetical protein [Nonomuraea harbinensis]
MSRLDDSGLTSVGQLGGLGPPHRGRGDADVALVDALDPLTWRAAMTWLAGRPSTARRRTCLRVLASWLRWLYAAEQGLEPLAASATHLDAYCYAALTTGDGVTARPLAQATVAGRRAVVASFYAHAERTGAVRAQRILNGTSRLTRDERRLLRRGIARLAGDGRRAEALAVALLEATGTSADALASLSARDLHALPGDGPPVVLVVRDERDPVAYPISPQIRRLLEAESAGRGADEPLIRRPDGGQVEPGWIADALTGAARAGGLPLQRAELLRPHLLRATGVHGNAGGG